MRQTNLAALDLNLLVALDAMLREGSVSRAARECGLSQPAMSRALARLRDLLDDPLLVRAGQRMVPTARAKQLQRPLEQALEAVRNALDASLEFDPATTSRSFALGSLDTTQLVVLPRLLEALSASAPNVRIATHGFFDTPEVVARLESGELDAAVGRFEALPPAIRSLPLFRERMVCLARRGHPRVGRRLTLRSYLAEAHVSAETVARPELPFTIESLLGERGHSRRVVATISNIALAPFIVSRTDLLCTAPARSIAPFCENLGVRMLRPPFETPVFEMDLIWHDRVADDPGHRWLRDTLARLFEVPADAGR